MNKEILRLAIPNIISNLSIPLLSSVDIILMGHLSYLELGAVGISTMIFNVLYWNFGFLRMGTTGLTAQAFGADNRFEINAILQRSLVLAMIISLSILVLMIPIASLSVYLMNVNTEQVQFVNDYFFIRVWAAPASLALYALFGWFFGMQNARIPLIITIAINLVNIAISYYLVQFLNLGIRGVALGTLIAQYFGFALALIMLFKNFRPYILKVKIRAIMAWQQMKRFLDINKDIFIRTVCLSLAFAFLYSQSALEGELYLAANVVLLQFMNIMSYGIDGFAYAAESLVGKYHGAQNQENTNKVIKQIFIWGAGLAMFYSLIYWGFGLPMIKVFTNQEEVIELSRQLLGWVIVLPIVSFACYIWDGIYIGITASKAMRNTMLISIVLYFATYYMLEYFTGERMIWLALLVFLAARGIFQSILFFRKGLQLH